MNASIIEGEEFEPPGTSTCFETAILLGNALQTKRGEGNLIAVNKPPRFHTGEKTKAFRRQYFPDISTSEWSDWRWQISHRLKHVQDLERMLVLTDEERTALRLSRTTLPMAVTPYYASLLDPEDYNQPLRRTVVPLPNEQVWSPGESEDPLDEEYDSPVPGLVHRYPDRVLFMVTDFCATYCRYCTRSRMVGKARNHEGGGNNWGKALGYIEATTTVRDVLLSGGDPLTLPDDALAWLLNRLRRIPHVELIRIGTKVPVVLPYRITPTLTKLMRRFHPLWMSIHVTHPDELTPEVNQACERLSDGGIPLGSQTVLLAGINDSVETMKRLFHALLRVRVKPYYLYQCDPIVGSAHFRTPVAKGLEIVKGLRGHTTGYSVPNYVIDAPGGGGKIPLVPEYQAGRDGDDLLLRNYEGNVYRYYDPQ